MSPSEMLKLIAEELNLRPSQIEKTVELLDTENTVPFIARYRKEATGSLDEDQIRAIEDRIKYLRNLDERKQTVLKSISDQGKLTPELEQKIKAAQKLQDVEDLYLPYKPKRRTRATIAKEKGLEPLAELIMKQETNEGDRIEIASQYIDEAKEVTSADAALAGARDIVAEIISEDADIRKIIRRLTHDKGLLASEGTSAESAKDYEIYQEFSEPIKTIPPHRILAINRGEREKMLRVSIDIDTEILLDPIASKYITNKKSIFTEDMDFAVADSYDRLISPAIAREMRKLLTEKADNHAIEIFAQNLKALLLIPPMQDKMIMGIDPGYRTGCKVAVIDSTGKYLEGDTIYPHPPQKQWQQAQDIVSRLADKYQVDIIAIGNGTASRETEQMVAEIIGQMERTVHYTIVSEAGASVYSASPIAKQEFPDLEASQRGNISIARRLMDPLSELVKIDPKSIGVGLYQHDVDQNQLSESLDHVVESCVNAVGVDLNTASSSLLKYVSGINSRVADNIVKHREENGKFHSRGELKAVKGLGTNAFVQASGFLRIPDGDIFFDRTAVHPESYGAAEKLLDALHLDLNSIKADGSALKKAMKQSDKKMSELAELCDSGQETLQDIIESLEKPNRDPRDKMDKPILRSDVLSMDDLNEGMILKGTVRNVVDFGAFVDIGVKQDGLVHLSKMAKRFIKHPLDVVSVGDVIEVKIMSIDMDRGRIGLSMLLDE